MSTVLSTASTTLFDASSTEGSKIGRVESYYVYNDSASASAVSVFINSQTLAREIPPGGSMVFSKRGKINLVTATAVSTATVYTGIQNEG